MSRSDDRRHTRVRFSSTVGGRVLGDGGAGIPGVAVSDGATITLTDRDGRYRLPVDPRRRHTCIVFVTVPSGWQAPLDGSSTPTFFRRVDLGIGSVDDIDFRLRADPPTGDDDYRFITLTDVHVQAGRINTEEVFGHRLEEINAHARGLAADGAAPRVVIVTGDLTNHATAPEFADYRSAIARSSLPVWSLPGNHDLPRPKPSGQEPAQHHRDTKPAYRDRAEGYRRAVGPEWYSFQYGRHHFVALENYYGFSEPDQLAWLEQDLDVHARDRPVIVASHVPWNVPETSPQLAPYRALLGRYDVRLILSGHSHANDVVTDVIDGAVHAVTTSAALSLDYSPIGFRVVEVRGDAIAVPFHHFEPCRTARTDRSPAAPASRLGPGGLPARPRQGSAWPMFHRDARHTGASSDAVVPPLSIAWVAPTGGTVLSSSPAVAAGAVFIGVRDEHTPQRNAVIALDLATGEQRWRVRTNGAIEGSVAVAHDVVLAPSVRGPLLAVEVESGSTRWEWWPEPNRRPCWMYFSPTVVDDTVFQAYSDRQGTWVVALDAATGDVRWHVGGAVGRDWISHGAPAVDDSFLVYAAPHAQLVALDATNGAVRWHVALGGGLGVRAKPVIVDGIVLLARQGDCLVAVDVDADGGSVRWSYAAEGAPLLPGAHTAATPAVLDGTAYAAFSDGSVTAIELATGTRRWRHQTGDAVLSSPAISGDLLYVGSNDGWLRALERATGRCVWAHDIGSWVVASPAVTGNAVVTAAWDGNVYAFTADYPS